MTAKKQDTPEGNMTEAAAKEAAAKEAAAKEAAAKEAAAKEAAAKEAAAKEAAAKEAAAKEAAKPKKETPIKVVRDIWDDDGTRIAKGETVNVTVAVAKKLIGEKKAERADPLPGEV
ncbi:hypothetical protein [uncultured Cohaesibacter sp.]|uniref:hypothetical protein n=1 Tax=uncultured Cohaesibacter sp. TaxID=1002546 RepID=UPI002AAC3568|nr:hypothetical protein [uncultured Cohaesibacter sp.]